MFRILGLQQFGKLKKININKRTPLIHAISNQCMHTLRPRGRRPFTVYGLGLIVGGLLAYDGINNDFTYAGAGVRFLRSVKVATLISIDYMLLSDNDENYDSKLKRIHRRSANRLLRACLDNGGLYIKVGQGVAAVNHILPKEYCTTLMRLQDECEFRPKKDVQKVFLEDFGMLPEQVFAEFDYRPKAAASLAQVFKAKLSCGEDVAVKVQYSDLQKRFISDLGTIIFLQSIIEFFFKSYNFGWILHNVRENLIHELDFIKEGQNAELCAEHMKDLDHVRVPKVYWPYSRQRILVLEWIDGMKISDLDYIHEKKLSLKDIDMKLYKICAEQIFHTGFVHADPHSSNIYVRKNEKSGKAEIILLDHGLYENVPEDVRSPLCEFWVATVLKNERWMQTTAAKLNVKEYMKFAEVLFQQPIKFESAGIKNKLTQEDIRYMQAIAKDNFERIMDTLKEMPRNLLFVVRNLNTIRAIGKMHGDVVDRPKVMARFSQSYLYNTDEKRSLLNYLRWLPRRIYFEYCLWKMSLKVNMTQFYFSILYYLGRAPKSAKSIVKQMLNDSYEEM